MSIKSRIAELRQSAQWNDCEGCGAGADVIEGLDHLLTKAEKLLSRALPDLRWAESAAESEWSASLEDMDIIGDIEEFLLITKETAE